MAVVPCTKTDRDDGFALVWEGLNSTDTTGQVWQLSGHNDIVVQVLGTFSSGTLSILGSVMGSTFIPVYEMDLTTLAVTATGFYYVMTPPDFIQPSLAGADGSDDINVHIRAFKRRS